MSSTCPPTLLSSSSSVSSTVGQLFGAASSGTLVSTIGNDLSTQLYRTQVVAEYNALLAVLLNIPPPGFICQIQSILRFLKIKPSPTSIAIQVFLIPIIFIAIITFTITLIWKFSVKHWQIALFILVILCTIYYFKVIREPFVNAPTPVIEAFQKFDPVPTGSNYTLLNIQPAAVKQVGFVGPREQNGKFDPTTGLLNTLNAGVRFLILQIDYLDSKKNSAAFDDVGVPTLIYRNNAGNIISSNGESIADIAKNLATYGFNPQVPTNTQPIILYLHFVRTPSLLKSPDKYMTFLSSVAAALQPIRSMILKSIEGTPFIRQQNEVALLNSPLSSFQNQIIILTNVDTSFFRNAAQLGLPTVTADQDLDSMVHLRVYLEDERDVVGATTVSANANAVILSYNRLNEMTQQQKMIFSEKGKSRFSIAMPPPVQALSPKVITNLFNTTGVNVIPVNLLGRTYQDYSAVLQSWSNTPFYKMKPTLLQSLKTSATGYNENFMSSP